MVAEGVLPARDVPHSIGRNHTDCRLLCSSYALGTEDIRRFETWRKTTGSVCWFSIDSVDEAKDESVPACSPQRMAVNLAPHSNGEAHSETPVSTADDRRPRALPVATRIREASLTVCAALRALVPGLGLRDLKTACLNAAWASTCRLSAKLVMRGNIFPRHEVFEFGTRYRVDCFVEDR
ncbi:hypothetical protein ABID19_006908 [Mesorhizobium robiniae]|uniref:Uncharacterized protein n=1 Tax=Mesorhizobium robiniae TaxID=559315 RepID=A0ABV2GZY4_9HYPH